MSKDKKKHWQDFLNEPEHEEQNATELKNELQAEGIDVNSFLADIQNTVRSSYREASSKQAKIGMSNKKALLDKVYNSIASLTRGEVLGRITQLAEQGNSEAMVFCRKFNPENRSDEDLKYLLVDFIINEGEKK